MSASSNSAPIVLHINNDSNWLKMAQKIYPIKCHYKSSVKYPLWKISWKRLSFMEFIVECRDGCSLILKGTLSIKIILKNAWVNNFKNYLCSIPCPLRKETMFVKVCLISAKSRVIITSLQLYYPSVRAWGFSPHYKNAMHI